MGRTSGAVRSGGVALDRELRDAYTLLVEARSGGAGGAGGERRVARARLHVTVTDVNDNCPVFVERPYFAAVAAGAAAGEPVLRVRALDLDANDNGEVSAPPRTVLLDLVFAKINLDKDLYVVDVFS